MRAIDIPTKFPIPFAFQAQAGESRQIPVASQQGIQPGAASLVDGFPPITFISPAAGGVPAFGEDWNGLFNQITAWLRWTQGGGGIPTFDANFVQPQPNGCGGYPAGAVLASATNPGVIYFNIVDNNTSNPDAGGAGWIGNGSGTGDIKWRPTQENLLAQGWAQANATTIGSTSSGASQLASPVAQNLYVWHWTNFSQTQCPVTGGRGSSALSDFNANKPIATLDMRGTSIAGMDTMNGAVTTRLSGVPVSSGAANIAGSLIGENLHALIAAENGPHLHGITDPGHTNPSSASSVPNAQASHTFDAGGQNPTAAAIGSATGTGTTGISTQSQGSGSGHNTVALSLTGTWYLKL